MKNVKTILVIVGLITLSACTKDVQKTNVICLADFSKSRDTNTIYWYKEVIKNNIISKLGSISQITVLPIDKASMTYCQEIYARDFSKNIYANEYAGLDAEKIEMKKHKDSLLSATREFDAKFREIRHARAEYDVSTDIVNALRQASKYRQSKERNVLIVLSDMIQSSDDGKCDYKTVEKLNEYLSTTEAINLKNTDIIVITGEQKTINAKTFLGIKSSWEGFFKRCGARLIDYESGSVTSLENYLTQ